MSDYEHDSGTTPFHDEGGTIIFERPKSGEEQSRQRRENEQHEFARSQVKTNKKLAWFTGALTVATFCTIGVGIWQGTISQRSANAARDAVIVASNTLTETQRSNAQQRLDNATAVQDAKVLADKSAAQADKALQATIANFKLDQRAWVGLCEFSMRDFNKGKPIRIQLKFCNSGKTPAHQVEEGIAFVVEPNAFKTPSEKDFDAVVFSPTNAVPPQGRRFF